MKITNAVARLGDKDVYMQKLNDIKVELNILKDKNKLKLANIQTELNVTLKSLQDSQEENEQLKQDLINTQIRYNNIQTELTNTQMKLTSAQTELTETLKSVDEIDELGRKVYNARMELKNVLREINSQEELTITRENIHLAKELDKYPNLTTLTLDGLLTSEMVLLYKNLNIRDIHIINNHESIWIRASMDQWSVNVHINGHVVSLSKVRNSELNVGYVG